MSMAGLPLMAKKKPTPDKWPSKPVVLQMRGSAEYKAWLDKLAEFDRSTIADLTDRALAKHAREIGFPDPPPRR